MFQNGSYKTIGQSSYNSEEYPERDENLSRNSIITVGEHASP